MLGIWQTIMIVNLVLIVVSIFRLIKIKPPVSDTICSLLAILLIPVIGSVVFLVRCKNPRPRPERAE